MSTRSNVIFITPDNKVHQFYHHFDGYLSGVGEDLRRHLLYSVGMHTLIKDMSIYDILVGDIANDSEYEDEYKSDLSERNGVHGDVEFVYVVKDADLYCVNEWDLSEKFETNKDLIDHICQESNKLQLSKRLHDSDE